MFQLNDDYLYALMEQGQESEVVCVCSQCGDDLYEGQEVVTDEYGNNFCDSSCCRDYHGIEFLDIEEGSNTYDEYTTCENCESLLLPDVYEAYKDEDNNMFCCLDCAGEFHGVKYAILEGDI